MLALTRRGSSGEGVVDAGLWKGLPPFGFAHVLSAVNLSRSLARVRAFAPNVIYERSSSFGLGAMYSRVLDIPMLTMLLDEHMSPLSLRRARHIITTNPALVPSSFRHKAVKVSWGANTQRFKPGLDGDVWRQKLGLSNDDWVIGYCGTFRPWHGLDVLLDVARECPANTRFLMVGPLERAAWFKTLVRSTRLTRPLRIHGHRTVHRSACCIELHRRLRCAVRSVAAQRCGRRQRVHARSTQGVRVSCPGETGRNHQLEEHRRAVYG